VSPDLVALHMGALHPYEKVLTLVLAFGPFVVLAAVIAVRRRHEAGQTDEAAEPAEADETAEADRASQGVSRRGPDRPTAR
jgi:hypothetical protein